MTSRIRRPSGRVRRIGVRLAVVLATAAAMIAPVAPVATAATPHWIGVRPIGPARGTELYDTRTGARFVPRGVNLLMDRPTPGGPYPYLNMIVSPGWYDQAWLDEQLAHIARLGFNTLRVWIDSCGYCVTNPDGSAVPEWLDNVAALLETAKAHGLVVVLVSNEMPVFGYADSLPCCDPFEGGFNAQILSNEGVDLTRVYWRIIVGGLVERGAPLEVVLAYELLNETQLEGGNKPFAYSTGLVTTANGATYDMAFQSARDEMVDDGLIFWADNVRATIRAIDPTALVTTGFFAPNGPHTPDPFELRIVRTERFLRESAMDLHDLHAYPGIDKDLWQIAENFTLDASVTRPVVMGEYGSIVPAHPDGEAAGDALQAWEHESCPLGFDGWIAWVWGSMDASVLQLAADGAAMASGIAPLFRPDPCAPPAFPNRALHRPVTVSSELPGFFGPYAVDGFFTTQWNSGNGPPGEITIDLGAPTTVREVRLLNGQDPAGLTTHRVEYRKQTGGWVLLQKLTGVTTDLQWLRVFPATPVPGVRWIRIKTQKTPSWVAWPEVQVY